MKHMDDAISEAKKAYAINEVPVGCVIVHKQKIVAKAHNTTIIDCNDMHHAEINALNQAINALGTKNLSECDMYVTVEPCPMCAGAIINTKIKRLFIGTAEPKSGCFGSITDFNKLGFNHHPEVYIGISEDECRQLMREFFHQKR